MKTLSILSLMALLNCSLADNDNFANAYDLGDRASVAISAPLVDSSTEAGEPDIDDITGETIWYKWTAPSSDTYSVTVDQAIARLDIYTGNELSSLNNEVTLNPKLSSKYGYYFDFDENYSTLTTSAGTDYYIRLSRSDQREDFPYADQYQYDFAYGFQITTSETTGGDLGTEVDFISKGDVLLSPEIGHTYTWTAPSNGTYSFIFSPFNTNFIYNSAGQCTIVNHSDSSILSTLKPEYSGNPISTSLTLTTGTTLEFNISGNSTHTQVISYYPEYLTEETEYVKALQRYQLGIFLSPPVDDFDDATALDLTSPVTLHTYSSPSLTSIEPGEEALIPWYYPEWNSYHSSWYKWTAPSDGVLYTDIQREGWGANVQLLRGNSLSELANNTILRSEWDNGSTAHKVLAGESYYLRISENTNCVEINLSFTSAPSTTFEYTTEAILTLKSAQSEADITYAQGLLDAALDLTPDHAAANLFSLVVELALLENDSSFSTLLSTLGITSLNSDVLNLEFDIPTTEAEEFNLSSTATSGDIFDYLSEDVLPQLRSLKEYLTNINIEDLPSLTVSSVNNYDGLYHLLPQDIYTIRAAYSNFLMLIEFLSVYDLSLHANDTLNNYDLTLEEVLDSNPDLLSLVSNVGLENIRTLISEVSTNVDEAVYHELGGIPFIYSEEASILSGTNAQGTSRRLELLELSNITGEIEAAFNEEVIVEYGDGSISIDLNNLIDATTGIRDWMPTIVKGNKFQAFTTADPTLSGTVQANQDQANSLLDSLGLLIEAAGFNDKIAELINNGDLPTELSGKDDDADGDGISNYDEYLFALDPTDSNSSVLSGAGMTSFGGTEYMTVSFKRRTDVSDIRYMVSVSDDLINWDHSEVSVSMIGSPISTGDGESEIVQYAIPTGTEIATGKYVRVSAIAE